jgi:hypothetical protein
VPGFYVEDAREAAALVREGAEWLSEDKAIDETIAHAMLLADDEVVLVFRVSNGKKAVGEHFESLVGRVVRRRLSGKVADQTGADRA